MEKIEYSDGTPTVKYYYDEMRTSFYNKGGLTRVETELVAATPADTPTTATEFDYDNMGRVTRHRQSIGTQTHNLAYGYNLAGQMTSETYPSGKIITTAYDAGGRLASIADQSRTYLASVGYLGKGNSVNSLVLGNGTAQGFAYNDRLQMESQSLTKPNEVLQQYNYAYGQLNTTTNTVENNGKLAQVESYLTGGSKQWTQKHKYDNLGRLKESAEYRGDNNTLNYKQTFDYDNFGNLYRKAANNQTTGQQSPLPFTAIEAADIEQATNRFKPATGTTYDDAGNVTTDNKFRAMSFGYDANGRMIKATKANTPDALSTYDASGQRVAECVNSIWKFFIYDAGGKMVAEYGGAPTADEGGVKYPYTDWQGSTRALTSNSGFVQSRQDFTAFGEEIGAGVGQRTMTQGFGAANNLTQKYAQTERDGATGLDHTWFRKLENRAGRWTSPDPYNGSASISDPQSFNRYTYVNNEPTNFIDPSGLFKLAPKPQVHTMSSFELCHILGSCGGSGIGSGGEEETGGGSGGGGSPPPPPDCDVTIPDNEQDKAAIGTLLNETTPQGYIGTRQYKDGDQIGNPSGEEITQNHLYGEAAMMMNVIINRYQNTSEYHSWKDVVSDSGQFLGYDDGSTLDASNFGTNGGDACERLRTIVKAVADSARNGAAFKNITQWRGVVQTQKTKNKKTGKTTTSKFVRTQGNAIRFAMTDFF